MNNVRGSLVFLLLTLNGSAAFRPVAVVRYSRTPPVLTQLSSGLFEQDPLSSAEKGNGAKSIPAYQPLRRPVRVFDPNSPVAPQQQRQVVPPPPPPQQQQQRVQQPPPQPVQQQQAPPPPQPVQQPVQQQAPPPPPPQQPIQQQQVQQQQPPPQQQQVQQQQQPPRRSYFEIASEFDRKEVSSWTNDPEFRRRLEDIYTYFELFDDPQAEWSSSEYIRREHHRRKKERKRVGHSIKAGQAREVSGSDSLQVYAKDRQGNQMKGPKRFVRYQGRSPGI